jgi:glyoxylase-like metal-dependent hydrolase (beta-lactamase superfamily II)
MRWLRRFGVAALVLAAIGAGLYWYYVADGAVPAQSAYKTDIAAWRQLVSGDSAQLPNEMRVEIVGQDAVPLGAMQAGSPFEDYPRVRASFQLNGPAGSVIIDTAMDKAIAAKAQRGPNAQFDEAAYGRMIAAMGVAAKVAVTHEHPDHIGGVARFPMPERLAERLVLTRKQYEGLGASTVDAKVPPAYANAQILDLQTPMRIAPGVVMIPAAGHTPGSVMFYVRMADQHEILFLGDIAWVLSNVRDLKTRPRFTQQFFMVSGEDRAKVADQIRALHDLAAAEPALTMIPAHDAPVIEALIGSGLIKEQFAIDGP